MSLDKLRPKKTEREKSKEVDKRLRVSSAYNMDHKSFTKTDKKKITSNIRRDAFTGGLEIMKEHFRTQRDIQRPNEATPQEQKLEELIQKVKRHQDIKEFIQKRAHEIIEGAGLTAHHELLQAYHKQDAKFLKLPKGLGDSSLIPEISSFSLMRIQENQLCSISAEFQRHIDTTYISAFERGFDKFCQGNDPNVLTHAGLRAHQAGFELMYHRSCELAFYENINSFTKLEIEQIKQEFDQQRRALEKTIGVPDVLGLTEEAGDILPTKTHFDLIIRYKSIASYDRSTCTEQFNSLEQTRLDQSVKIAEDLKPAIEKAREREQAIQQSIDALENDLFRKQRISENLFDRNAPEKIEITPISQDKAMELKNDAVKYNEDAKQSRAWINGLIRNSDITVNIDKYSSLVKDHDSTYEKFEQKILVHEVNGASDKLSDLHTINGEFAEIKDNKWYKSYTDLCMKIVDVHGYIRKSYFTKIGKGIITYDYLRKFLNETRGFKQEFVRSVGENVVLDKLKANYARSCAVARKFAERLDPDRVQEFTTDQETSQQN